MPEPGWVFPESVGQVAATLRDASAARTRVRPAGAGTRTLGAPAPITISTTRMSQVLDYEPADLVVSAQAGATMHTLRLQAAEHQQQLALDAPAQWPATLGATVALNAAGPLRQGYGTPRDQVLGLQLVTGDGRIVHIGGKVVKNVAGYDLTRLVIGSKGALGVITQVHVRLYPLPEQDVTFVLSGDSAQLIEAAPRITRAHFEPHALELYARERIGQLVVRVQGNADVIQAARHALSELGLKYQELSPEAALKCWTDASHHELSASVLLRLAAAPAHLATTVQLAFQLAELVPRSGQDIVLTAHAGSGIVRVGGAAHDPAALSARLRPVRHALAQIRGSVRVERAPFELPQTRPAPGVVKLLEGLKKVFDPADILPAHWRDGEA